MGRCCGGAEGGASQGRRPCGAFHGALPPLLLLASLPLQALGSSFERRHKSTGCRNWKAIGMRKHDKVDSPAECAEICSMITGCVGFGFQVNNHCHPRGNTEIGACMLWKGKCDNDGNGCWDDYLMIPSATTTVEAELVGQLGLGVDTEGGTDNNESVGEDVLGGTDTGAEESTDEEDLQGGTGTGAEDPADEDSLLGVKTDGEEYEEEKEISKCGYRWWVSLLLIIASCTQVLVGLFRLRRYLNPCGTYVQQADGADDERFFDRALQAEILFGLLVPWLAAGIGIPVAMLLNVRHDGLLFAQLLFLGLVGVRTSFVDITLWRTMMMSPATAEPVRKAPFLRSKLRAMDTVAGGLAVTNILLMECSPLFLQRLELVLGFLGPRMSSWVLAWVHFFGLADTMLVFLAAACMVRMEVAMRLLEHDDGAAIAAEDAGFGATATVFKRKQQPRGGGQDEEEAEEGRRAVVEAPFYNMILLMVEGTPQFFLLSIAVLASGRGLVGNPLLAISIGLSGLVVASRGVQLIWHLLCGLCSMPTGRVLMAIGGVPAVFCLLLVVATGVTLLLSEAYCFRSLLFDLMAGHCMLAPVPSAEPIPLLQWFFALAGLLPAGAVVLALSVVNIFWRANEQPSEEVEALRGTGRKVRGAGGTHWASSD